MKRITGFTIAIVTAASMWSCSTSYMAQQGEYDNMYYGSKDRQTESYKKVNFNEYSNYRDDSNPTRISGNETLSQDSYSAKTINPDYISKYNTDPKDLKKAQVDSSEYGEGEYYVEDYDDNNKPIINNYYGYNPYDYRYNYNYYGYYDPFYYPFYYYYRPGFSISWSYGYSWNYWNTGYFYDPYWGYSPSYCYRALYSPYGYCYGAYYGHYSYYPWSFGNTVYYNNGYVNLYPDNISTHTRKIVVGPRPSRGEVNDLAGGGNNPHRSVISRTNDPVSSRTRLDSNTPTQSSYYRRSRVDDLISTGSLEGQRTETYRSRNTTSPNDNSRPSTNYVRPKTSRSTLNDNRSYNYNPNTIQRSGNIDSRNAQRSSSSYRNYNYNKTNTPNYRQNNYRQSTPVQMNRNNSRSYQYSRPSTPTRTVTPNRSYTPSRSTPSRSSGSNNRSGSSTRSGSNNSSSSNSRRGNN